jgi:hypothetical protein
VAVVVRRRRARSRPVLARLPVAIRHRAHLTLCAVHPRLDDAGDPHARPGRPLDLARHSGLHRTTPGSQSRQ